MSRTDKTMPWSVHCTADPAWLREYHDHTDPSAGPCDLPPRPVKVERWRETYAARRRGEATTRCRWEPSREFWITVGMCGCPRCTDQEARRVDRRRDRHQAHQQARVERVMARSARCLSDLDDLEDLDAEPGGQARGEVRRRFEDLYDLDTDYRSHAAVARMLDLQSGALVVAVDLIGGDVPEPHDLLSDCNGECCGGPLVFPESVKVTVMHPDGRRERLTFTEPWAAFAERVTAANSGGDHARLLARFPSVER